MQNALPWPNFFSVNQAARCELDISDVLTCTFPPLRVESSLLKKTYSSKKPNNNSSHRYLCHQRTTVRNQIAAQPVLSRSRACRLGNRSSAPGRGRPWMDPEPVSRCARSAMRAGLRGSAGAPTDASSKRPASSGGDRRAEEGSTALRGPPIATQRSPRRAAGKAPPPPSRAENCRMKVCASEPRAPRSLVHRMLVVFL
jgi:hypothetical protein